MPWETACARDADMDVCDARARPLSACKQSQRAWRRVHMPEAYATPSERPVSCGNGIFKVYLRGVQTVEASAGGLQGNGAAAEVLPRIGKLLQSLKDVANVISVRAEALLT